MLVVLPMPLLYLSSIFFFLFKVNFNKIYYLYFIIINWNILIIEAVYRNKKFEKENILSFIISFILL